MWEHVHIKQWCSTICALKTARATVGSGPKSFLSSASTHDEHIVERLSARHIYGIISVEFPETEKRWDGGAFHGRRDRKCEARKDSFVVETLTNWVCTLSPGKQSKGEYGSNVAATFDESKESSRSAVFARLTSFSAHSPCMSHLRIEIHQGFGGSCISCVGQDKSFSCAISTYFITSIANS